MNINRENKEKTILHCDMNNYFASVELLEHPEMKWDPVIVSGALEGRHGIVLAKNQIARMYGIVTAESVYSARKKCPHLKILAPHHEKYQYFSKKINNIYLQYTDLVEPFSIDESWLDVTGSTNLFGSGVEIANGIREHVKDELGLTLSVGVSFNKVFAKMGSNYKKPDATTEISKDNYRDIIWPMDVSELIFVGRATEDSLKKMNIFTIGDLAKTSPSVLRKNLGKQGSVLWEYATGNYNSDVKSYFDRDPVKSIGNGRTFEKNLDNYEEISAEITKLADTVSTRLRASSKKALGVKVDIKDPEFRTISRQTRLDIPTNTLQTLRKEALQIIKSEWGRNEDNTCKPIRLLTLTAINLIDETDVMPMSLFEDIDKNLDTENEAINRTMDEIRRKFGGSAINFGLDKNKQSLK